MGIGEQFEFEKTGNIYPENHPSKTQKAGGNFVTVYKCGASTCSYYDAGYGGRNKCTLDEIIDASGSCDNYQTRADDE